MSASTLALFVGSNKQLCTGEARRVHQVGCCTRGRVGKACSIQVVDDFKHTVRGHATVGSDVVVVLQEMLSITDDY